MSYASPTDSPELWDIVIANGIASPGVAKVDGAAILYSWDKKVGKGIKGGTTTFVGVDVPEFTIELQLFWPEHFVEWAAWSALWAFDPTKARGAAVEVLHPSLFDAGITQATAKKIVPPVPTGKGMWIAKLECIKYAPPPKQNVTSTPKGASGTATATGGASAGTQPKTATDKLEEQVAQLTAQAQQAGGPQPGTEGPPPPP